MELTHYKEYKNVNNYSLVIVTYTRYQGAQEGNQTPEPGTVTNNTLNKAHIHPSHQINHNGSDGLHTSKLNTGCNQNESF
jgi:hypothetical protein